MTITEALSINALAAHMGYGLLIYIQPSNPTIQRAVTMVNTEKNASPPIFRYMMGSSKVDYIWSRINGYSPKCTILSQTCEEKKDMY